MTSLPEIGRRVVRALLAASILLAFAPVAAHAETVAPDYSWWVTAAGEKTYPTSLPPASAGRASLGTGPSIGIAAAQAEYEGRQVIIRAGATPVQDVWLEASDLTTTDVSGTVSTISADNVTSYKIGYVYISKPSYPLKRVGLEPDPLLPMTIANGERLGWKPDGAAPYLAWRGAKANTTQPFYLLFKVPEGSTPGTYTGTIKVTGAAPDGTAAPEVNIPVTLKVQPFSVRQKTLNTSFGTNLQWAMYTNSASHKWLGVDYDGGPTRVPERTTYRADQLGGWLRYMSEHRVSPQNMLPAWEGGSNWAPPADNGNMVVRREVLEDYLGAGAATTFEGDKLSFNSVKMPEYGAPPWVVNPFASPSYYRKAARYYATMKQQLGRYVVRAYVYPIDEPPASKRAFVQNYACMVHKYAPGVKFFVTTDPVTQNYKLIPNVDLYGQKLQFYYRDWYRWIRPIRVAKKNVWIYSHATKWQSVTPNCLIDQPLASSRVQAWFAYHTRADGLLYFNISAWRPSTGSATFRDPYRDPLSYRATINGKPLYANGDGSLVYPGYYPALGLYVEGAAPVGSLRFEAIRDGLEDYEYLKLIATKYSSATADSYAKRVIGPLPAAAPGKLLFPPWAKSASTYEAVRRDMAALLAK